jgi:4-amino-4-deoxy-L-arabinose transferase-like glycosyltransferase
LAKKKISASTSWADRPLARWLIPSLLVLVFLVARLPALGRFVTTDEALWLRRSANFYLALSTGDAKSAFQSPHPGAITQWAGAAGFWLRFPDYARVGTPEIHDTDLLTRMENRDITPMEVLSTARAALVLVHAGVFLAAWPFARRLLGPIAAIAGFALVALDPFLIAHQRLLHLDGLLASFMLLAVLAYVDFARHKNPLSLVVSAIATGLAWLTKTPALYLLAPIGALMLWHLWGEHETRPRGRDLTSPWIAPFAWLGIALLTVFALFPAMWAAPVEVASQMISYALGSAEGEFSGPVFFNGAVYPDGNLGSAGWIFYAVSFLWRSTPLVLLGLALTAFFLIRKRAAGDDRFALYALIASSLGFLLLMTVAEKKFDRYLLPAMPALILSAGWGWHQFAASQTWLRQRSRGLALLAAVALLQAISAFSVYPYYLSYYNPVLGGAAAAPRVMMIGWGEGLDQAAAYLNQQSYAPGEAASWYSVSTNLLLSQSVDDIPISLELSESELAALLAKKYLVIYVHQWQRGTPQNLLDALQDIQPEHSVWIDGIEYARVYHFND